MEHIGSRAMSLYLSGRMSSAGCADFRSETRARLEAISRAVRKSDLPCCMYPGCTAESPPEDLHLHHIVPKRYWGGSEQENGILLCARHHLWAHHFIFPPAFCLAFRDGRFPPDFQEMLLFPLERLWQEVCDLSEFSPVSNTMDDERRLETLALIRMVAAYHPSRKSNRGIWARIMAWSASEQAAMLTAIVPGRMPTTPIQRHPRHLITDLLTESNRYSQHAGDRLLAPRNLNVSAVNYNALLQFHLASRDIQKSESCIPETGTSDMHMDLRDYRAYVARQGAAIFAKTGDDRASRAARRAIRLSRDVSESAHVEANVRYLEAAILVGDVTESRKAFRQVLEESKEGVPIRVVIRQKVLAAYHLCLEDYRTARHLTEAALGIALRAGLGHQGHKLQNMLVAIERRKTWRRNWALGANGKTGGRPSLRLAALL